MLKNAMTVDTRVLVHHFSKISRVGNTYQWAQDLATGNGHQKPRRHSLGMVRLEAQLQIEYQAGGPPALLDSLAIAPSLS